ncbi:serine hydrolase domain-containing protein [Jannaschia sp. R86511]|uniref:serine hydrolase domain-containing protein n=1 Tax=Jannaschia sp. R86511 TaxID=3093853 RepID=UPI0036D2DBAC
MSPTYHQTPSRRPSRGRPDRPGPRLRRGLRSLAALALLAVTVAGLAPGAAAGSSVADPTPPPPVPAPAGQHTLEPSDVDAWLDGMLPAALEREGHAGAVVAVVADGEVVTTRGYGHADTGTTGGEAVPVDAERTLFRVGSISKLFTATAVMQLVERGEVDLDTDVAEYLDFEVPRAFDEPVTLRHLLTHTAGFEERIRGLIGSGDVEVVLRDSLAEDPPEQIYAPGTVPAYSNYGNALAGYVVERVSGVPFEEYVRREVLEPAGMTSSTFAQPLPAGLRDRMSQGYPTSADEPGPFEIVGAPPAGALTASAPDMARFMLAQLGEPGTRPLLRPETLELMHAPALDESTLGTLAAGPRMTLGFFEESRNGHRMLGHGGDTQYFHSDLLLHPEEGAGIYVSVNSSGEDGYSTLALRAALLEGFTDRYFPAGAGETKAPDPTRGSVDETTAKEHAAVVEGSYVSSRTVRSNFLAALEAFGTTQVEARPDGRLLLTPGPTSAAPALYEEVEPFVWREVDGQRTITARVDGDRVEAIGISPAFALLPAQPGRSQTVLLPVVGASALVLLVAVLAWPVGAVRRRVRGQTLPRGTGRVSRVLTMVAATCTLLALAGWAVTLVSVMNLQDVAPASLRQVQVVQVLGLLGLVPAVLQLVGAVRHRHGWRRVAGTGLVVLALAGIAWCAVSLGLLAPSVSY